MAESEPSRVLNISNCLKGDNQQQYVQIGSNMFFGTQDGIKYTLFKASDSKFHLVETLSESSGSLNTSKEFYTTPETVNHSERQNAWSEPTGGSKIIKLMAVKPEQSTCKGQGDEFGNSVISPILPISSFNKSESAIEGVTFEDTPSVQDGSSQLTYTTLLPKQQNKEILNNTYLPTPKGIPCNYPATVPSSVLMGPPRYSKRGRPPKIRPSLYSPISGPHMGSTRQRRSRCSNSHQYVPQILHSTPNTHSSSSYSSNSLTSSSASSSGIENSSSISNSLLAIEYPRAPNNTPNSSAESASPANQKRFSIQWLPHIAPEVENYLSLDPREIHNAKERKRRLRIKKACQCMRSLLPCLVEKIDNTSVFEHAVSFISFMRQTVGDIDDIEFLENNYIFDEPMGNLYAASEIEGGSGEYS